MTPKKVAPGETLAGEARNGKACTPAAAGQGDEHAAAATHACGDIIVRDVRRGRPQTAPIALDAVRLRADEAVGKRRASPHRGVVHVHRHKLIGRKQREGRGWKRPGPQGSHKQPEQPRPACTPSRSESLKALHRCLFFPRQGILNIVPMDSEKCCNSWARLFPA